MKRAQSAVNLAVTAKSNKNYRVYRICKTFPNGVQRHTIKRCVGRGDSSRQEKGLLPGAGMRYRVL